MFTMQMDLVEFAHSDIGKMLKENAKKLMICVNNGVNKMENVQAVMLVMD